MKRSIINKETISFFHDDRDVIGFLVGGELTTEEPSEEEKETFQGDWSEVTLGDIWSMIHNGDRTPVTLWHDTKTWITYYPHHDDDSRFRVITASYVD